MKKIFLIRPPHTYYYNDLDVREEAILSYLGGYFIQSGFTDFKTFDFHLQRDLNFEDLTSGNATDFIISVRETGENVHYALRLAKALSINTLAKIYLYGQTSRLKHFQLPERVSVFNYSEEKLAKFLGIEGNHFTFEKGLVCEPYIDNLQLKYWQKERVKASIETTRGCQFKCDFCFINLGGNYDKKWLTRPIDAILTDIKKYQDLGISNIVFYDSEFFGFDIREHRKKEDLLTRIKDNFPRINYKIYSRADTLMKFGNFDLLKDSGLVSVFIGVESLYQPDLDSLNKKLDVSTILNCINKLRNYEIYTDLSFIFFNRNTTIKSIEHNLTVLYELFHSDSRYLGMPHFSFSFESGWKPKTTQGLSSKTYINWDVMIKSPPKSGACFDVSLEPLMEIYRLLSYEWSKKVIQINHQRRSFDLEELDSVESWFNNLGLFCIESMLYFLNNFKSGKLTLENLESFKSELFSMILNYHQKLPISLRSLSTYSDHAKYLDYDQSVNLLEGEEYWEKHIPIFDFAKGI